jgi:hypothetical protein
VIDDETVNCWAEECAPDSAHPHLRSLLKKDCDGRHYLDFLDPRWSAFFPWTDDDIGTLCQLIPHNS